MAFLFQKFQEAVKTLAKSSTFAKDPRHLQFEADINRLFLYTSYNCLGKDAEEADAEEIIDMAGKASLDDQQKQVQENIHSQIKNFCMNMDEILLPVKNSEERLESAAEINNTHRQSGLSFAIGRAGSSPSPSSHYAVPETKPLKLADVSQAVKGCLGYSLAVRPSEIPHKDAGRGLFLEGEAEVGSVIAIYPGVIYSPAYYRYIPGYPRVDAHNSYLITRYDGTVINAQPWGNGDDTREFWDGTRYPRATSSEQIGDKGSDRLWKVLSKPLESSGSGTSGEILERRNPLAFAHFANHLPKGMVPNVMVCPYDFPLEEKDMRSYIPNISFGSEEGLKMRRFGSFWFKSWNSSVHGVSDSPILKSLVLVATRALSNEEVLLNYRLSNSKRRPTWYTPVDEVEDRRRWG